MIISNSTTYNFEETLNLLCSVLKVKEGELHEEGYEVKFKLISSIIFDILKIISRTQRFCEYLVESVKFVKLVARAFSITDREVFDQEDLKKITQILQNILQYEDIEAEKFLVNSGLILYFLHIILEKNFHRSIR
mmetsp:Transcript_19742/g.14469  ORF Transcript_19742/g.14469 Transcript_19742/m.14469 type:complete len:135 (-) Transcript_19742:1137-1541(-)